MLITNLVDRALQTMSPRQNGCKSMAINNKDQNDKSIQMEKNENCNDDYNLVRQNILDDMSNVVASDISGQNNDVKVILLETRLWRNFYNVVNEMIVTREGRRLFPVLKLKVLGLVPIDMYKFEMDLMLVENNRLKYVNGEWVHSSKSDMPTISKTYIHPDSPNYGKFWMESYISFSRIKITNREDADGNKIFLYSMYKYVPRIHIKKIDNETQSDVLIGTFSFKETEFVAVTAYQNDSVTSLKVKFNPFAKAFLDPKNIDKSHDRSDCMYTNNYYQTNNHRYHQNKQLCNQFHPRYQNVNYRQPYPYQSPNNMVYYRNNYINSYRNQSYTAPPYYNSYYNYYNSHRNNSSRNYLHGYTYSPPYDYYSPALSSSSYYWSQLQHPYRHSQYSCSNGGETQSYSLNSMNRMTNNEIIETNESEINDRIPKSHPDSLNVLAQIAVEQSIDKQFSYS